MTNTDSPLDDLKKNAQVRKFMTKYRYQYHQTMLNDLVTLMDSYCHKQVIEARVDELQKMLAHAREHTITDIEMVMHHSGNTIDFIEGVDTRHFEKRLAELKDKLE